MCWCLVTINNKWEMSTCAQKQKRRHFHAKTTVHWRSTQGAGHIPLEIRDSALPYTAVAVIFILLLIEPFWYTKVNFNLSNRENKTIHHFIDKPYGIQEIYNIFCICVTFHLFWIFHTLQYLSSCSVCAPHTSARLAIVGSIVQFQHDKGK